MINKLTKTFLKGVNPLFAFVPISLALGHSHTVNSLWVFVTAALAIVPIAGLMSKATEELSTHLGPTWGGLMNATFGNAAELIIGIFALRAGLVALVQASIIGSILGNLLLVLGASIFAGGIKYKFQTFNRDQAEMHAINLILASLSLAIPAIFALSFHRVTGAKNPDIVHLSLFVSGILLVVYLASLWFSLRTHESVLGFECGGDIEDLEPQWSKLTAFFVLAAATVLVSFESELLVSSVTGAIQSMGVNQVFIGIVVIAIIGNAAEHTTAVSMAIKNRMDVSINIAIGSSTQIAMFVAPLLVLVSMFMPHKLTFIFTVPEMTAIAFSVIITAFIAGDGRCHWLEGAQLLAAYAVIAVSFFFLPQ